MKIFSLVFCVFLFSCSSKDISYQYPDNPDYVRNSRAGTAFSKGDLVVYGKKKDDEKPNKKRSGNEKSTLWQASVRVIGELFPIAILNQESGIITTEWYQESPDSNERMKINATIKGQEAKKENLQITIFRQKKSAGKNSVEIWEDKNRESSDSKKSVAKILQDKIWLELNNF